MPINKKLTMITIITCYLLLVHIIFCCHTGAVTPMETTPTNKSTPTKAESHSTTAEPSSASTSVASSSAPVPSSAQQTTPVAPQVHIYNFQFTLYCSDFHIVRV